MSPLKPTISQILASARHKLQNAGIANAALDARLLLMHAANLSQEDLVRDAQACVDNDKLELFNEYIDRRLKHEPVSRIRGRREFWSMEFYLSNGTLDPRPDSETVVEAVLDWVKGKQLHDAPIRIVDLGTGSGCLLISVLSELPKATGVGIDISADSIMTAADNAQTLGVSERASFQNISWDALDIQDFDVVISNPPYIPESDSESLSQEVLRFDPENALYGGIDGLENYRKIALLLKNFLAENGAAFFEIGKGQFKDVQQLFEAQGFLLGGVKCDLAGIERCIWFDSPNCG